MGGACSTYGRDEKAYKILAGNSEEKRPLGRPGRRWEDDIGMVKVKKGKVFPVH